MPINSNLPPPPLLLQHSNVLQHHDSAYNNNQWQHGHKDWKHFAAQYNGGAVVAQ
jgi:hypothetical protein